MVMEKTNRKRKMNLCECGCGKEVKTFRARFLPGHHTKFLKGEKNSFYGKSHTEFAKSCIRASKSRNTGNIKDIRNI